jgi:hypothetical protein
VAQFDDDLRRRFDGLEEALRARMRTDGLAVVEQRARGRRRRRRGAVVLAVAAVAAVAALADTGLFPLAQRDPQPLTPVPPVTTGPTAASADAQVLTFDGLAGIATFGEPQDRVVARLVERFGAPNENRIWNQSGRQYFGACPGDRHRFLRWGRLFALFTDGSTNYSPAGRWHFFAWYAENRQVTGSLDPATAAGIRVGSTVAELRTAYRSSVRISEGPPSDGFVIIGRGGIHGVLSNTSTSGRVTQLSAGEVCGE